MSKIRILRLQNDYKRLMNINGKSPYISIEPKGGNPPDRYLITYKLPGYINSSGAIRNVHQVAMLLPEAYPLQEAPQFKFLEELWHPNVYTGGAVCLGSNWNVGFEIDQLIYDIGNMIRFGKDSYNLGSPARRPPHALDWERWINHHKIPLLEVNLMVSDTPNVRIIPKGVIPTTPQDVVSPPTNPSGEQRPTIKILTKVPDEVEKKPNIPIKITPKSTASEL